MNGNDHVQKEDPKYECFMADAMNGSCAREVNMWTRQRTNGDARPRGMTKKQAACILVSGEL